MKEKKHNITLNAERSRLVSVDMMVGLAMIFVVLGHHTFDFSPRWYSRGVHEWIYMFHMEVFMFLSAFLIRYSYKGVSSVKQYLQYVGRKFVKFFIPFLFIGLAVALSRSYAMGLDMNLMWPTTTMALKTLVLYPMWSDASFLWYIYVLFGFYVISPLVIAMPRMVKMILCVASLALQLLPAGHLLGSFLFCKYTFFYLLGILCGEGVEEFRSIKTWVWGLLSIPFVVWSVLVLVARIGGGIDYEWLLVAPWQYHVVEPCIAIPFFYFFARLVGEIGWVNNILTSISENCFWIYLLQMFVIWACVYAMQISGLQCPFVIFMLISVVLAIAVPIAIQKISSYLPKLRSKVPKSKKK